MSQNESVNFFLRLVKQKHALVKQQMHSLQRTIAGENADQKKGVAEQLVVLADDLRSILANEDIPSWLITAITHSKQFVDGSMKTPTFLETLISFRAECEGHRWAFQDKNDKAFDFDAIYEHYKKESRLPELFDEVVRILQDIHDSGDIDSVMMMQALGKVIATIKKCKNGSYFSLNSAWDFLWTFVKNYLWNELCAVPGLGTAAASLRTAMENINDEMFSVHSKIQGEIQNTVGTEIKKLEGKAKAPFLSYDKNGYSLPDLGTRLIESKA